MIVEIEIKKRDLHNIFCAALHHYYRDLQSHVDEESDGVWHSELIDDLYQIRGACNTISHLCDLIEDLDTVDDDDAAGVIRFEEGGRNRNDE